MKSLVDGDIVAYRCAASCMPTKAKPVEEPLEEALSRIDFLMARILEETLATDHLVAIGGETNYRYNIYPAYKANRLDKKRPTYLATCKKYLQDNWKAQVTVGIEADDLLGIEQKEGSVICSIDKDLLQIPGRHYNFVKQEWRYVDDLTGLRFFYKQVITGDASDNIPGFDGKLRSTTPMFIQKILDPLDECFDEGEMYQYTRDVYGDAWDWATDWEDKLHTAAKLLFIQRMKQRAWEPPHLGQLVENKVS